MIGFHFSDSTEMLSEMLSDIQHKSAITEDVNRRCKQKKAFSAYFHSCFEMLLFKHWDWIFGHWWEYFLVNLAR